MSDLNKRQAGVQEITQMLYNVNFAGTNSKEEFTELQNNMIQMLNQHQYSYGDIENYFIGWGYQVPMIKEIYKHLTGLDPERVNSTDYLMNIPGCIPGFNYGWGEGKGKKYKYVFVITYKSGFGVFGQVDDLVRELIEYTLDLEEAFSILDKNAKNVKTCKTIITVPEKDILNNQKVPYLCTDGPITQRVMFKGRTASLAKAIDEIPMQAHEVRAMLRIAYDNNEITAQEHKDLYNYYTARFAEDESEDANSDITKELEKQEISKVKVETPKEAMDNVKQDKTVSIDLANIADCVKRISDYLTENLSDIYEKAKVVVNSLNFTKKNSDTNVIEKTPEVPGQNPKQYFDKTALFTVVLDVQLFEKSNVGVQPVLAVFMLNDKGDVTTDGNFKGVNDELYPLNLSGIENYFNVVSEVEEQPVTKE